jgi:Coenzyme PQQ synthesis protein D (PqqD)
LYEVSAGVRSTRNEDGGIVLDIDHGQMFRLNPVGALILQLLGNGCAEAEIAQEIARQYNTNEEIVLADVREFLQSLEEHKLVRSQPGGKVS